MKKPQVWEFNDPIENIDALENYSNELEYQNKELRDTGSKIVDHIITNSNTLTNRSLLKMCGDFNKLKK